MKQYRINTLKEHFLQGKFRSILLDTPPLFMSLMGNLSSM